MDTPTALARLGVTDDLLDDDQRAALDRDGFLPLPDVLTPDEVRAVNDRTARLLAEEGDRAGLEVHQEAGAARLADLVNKDPLFTRFFTEPRVLAAVRHVLGDFRLSSLNSRAALPGHGRQALHADLDLVTADGVFRGCNTLWMLDDFTARNGATRIVPGSHRLGVLPRDTMADPADPHPDERLVTGRAGTVVVFNAHAWHGGTANRGDRPRRALHGFFAARDLPQQLDQQAYLRPETWHRLTPAAHHLLDVTAP